MYVVMIEMDGASDSAVKTLAQRIWNDNEGDFLPKGKVFRVLCSKDGEPLRWEGFDAA